MIPALYARYALYATDDRPACAKIVHLHYFAGACDWWIAEYDPPPAPRSGTPASATRTAPNGAT
jgi:hypothetical protein